MTEMDSLKNFIDNNREAFEDNRLPLGHKMRFYVRGGVDMKKYLIAAAILLFGIVSPMLYNSYFNNGPEKYKKVLKEREGQITVLASSMDERDKKNILMILDQLVKETIPLEEQLPETLSGETKNEIITNYYKTKIEGADKLLAYAESIE